MRTRSWLALVVMGLAMTGGAAAQGAYGAFRSPGLGQADALPEIPRVPDPAEDVNDYCAQAAEGLLKLLEEDIDGQVEVREGIEIPVSLPDRLTAFEAPLRACERRLPDAADAARFGAALSSLQKMRIIVQMGVDAQRAGVLDALAATGTGLVPQSSAEIRAALR